MALYFIKKDAVILKDHWFSDSNLVKKEKIWPMQKFQRIIPYRRSRKILSTLIGRKMLILVVEDQLN